MKRDSNRRQFIKWGAGAAGALALFSPFSKALAETCGLTPPQTAGPFFPGEKEFHPDTDLTYIAGHSKRAKGKVISVVGRVLDQNCKPISGAAVEIWQACASGRYNNPKDTNPAAMDPDFKYWGEDFTDDNGRYRFKTVIPGAYPADVDWTRPPHIHFKITKLGFHELTTQLYFKGDPLNDKDYILQKIPEHQRDQVIVEFVASDHEGEIGTLTGKFDISLKSIR
ncbi:MAG: protocatechuate 3,4-dioxygenase [Bdellovibrionota bacterium]